MLVMVLFVSFLHATSFFRLSFGMHGFCLNCDIVLRGCFISNLVVPSLFVVAVVSFSISIDFGLCVVFMLYVCGSILVFALHDQACMLVCVDVQRHSIPCCFGSFCVAVGSFVRCRGFK